MLRISDPPSVPSYSKAPRGLLVLARVTRIFTGIAISPSPSLRQRPSRYAIRAGRFLADKEFRYLRTVIVTADIHQDLGSELRTKVLTPHRNLLALVTCHILYVDFRLSRMLCFC